MSLQILENATCCVHYKNTLAETNTTKQQKQTSWGKHYVWTFMRDDLSALPKNSKKKSTKISSHIYA